MSQEQKDAPKYFYSGTSYATANHTVGPDLYYTYPQTLLCVHHRPQMKVLPSPNHHLLISHLKVLHALVINSHILHFVYSLLAIYVGNFIGNQYLLESLFATKSNTSLCLVNTAIHNLINSKSIRYTLLSIHPFKYTHLYLCPSYRSMRELSKQLELRNSAD